MTEPANVTTESDTAVETAEDGTDSTAAIVENGGADEGGGDADLVPNH